MYTDRKNGKSEIIFHIFGFTAITGFTLSNGLALSKVIGGMTTAKATLGVAVDMGKDEVIGQVTDLTFAHDLYDAYHPKTTDGTSVRVNDVDTHGRQHTADGDNNGGVSTHDGDSCSPRVHDSDLESEKNINDNNHVHDTGSDSVRDKADNSDWAKKDILILLLQKNMQCHP